MSIRRLSLTTTLGAFGALLVAAFAGTACTVTSSDNDAGPTTTPTGDDSGTGGTTDTGTTGDDSGSGMTDTGTTGSDACDNFFCQPPPSTSPVFARFVLASSDFATGTNFDICYAPWDGNTGAYPMDGAYQGPIAAQVSGGSGNFTSPEVTYYFPLLGVDGSSVNKVAVRLVAAGTSCAGSNRFKLGGSTIKVDDSMAGNLVAGYNTVVVYGNLGTSSTFTLTDHFFEDPTKAPSVPTLEFFNGYTDGSSPTIGFTFTGSDGTVYNFNGASGLNYGSYTELPLQFTGSFGAAISINTAAFTINGGSALNISLGGFSLAAQYYWGFAYGTSPTTDFHFYLCPDNVAVASSSGYAVTGCNIYNP
jgi:hypothetical protein